MTVRTSITFTPGFHQRLKQEAQHDEKSMNDLMQEILQEGLAKREQRRTKKMYQALDKLIGIGPKGITDASTTIDEVLYGENGAWRGQQD